MLKWGITALLVSLAGHAARMQADVRHRVQSQRDTQPMFDTDRFRRHIEAAYLRIWDIFKRGDAPRSFTVSSD